MDRQSEEEVEPFPNWLDAMGIGDNSFIIGVSCCCVCYLVLLIGCGAFKVFSSL